MNGKELRKFSRRDLIAVLLEQTLKIEELEEQLEKANLELSERKTNVKEVGSLAEAALVLSDIFKKADETAKVYIKNVENRFKIEEKNNKKKLNEFRKKKLAEIDEECERRILAADAAIEKLEKKMSKIKEGKAVKKTKKKKLEVKEEKVVEELNNELEVKDDSSIEVKNTNKSRRKSKK